ncbi:MAG: peptide MFS transporter [Elusimicrobia bacterium]|nr:peptide MFS transporter [Elusimicrobiota bacterium]MDD7502612.1 peptide MFS transporter [Elusimicrobiota bacterium]MDY5729125.1 peptide MFS transporter [Elusimicrobiaceae bacterium]
MEQSVVKTKQPTGLWLLFMTELWERFSYYAMRSILVLYMVYLLQMDKSGAANVYGTFTSLVYLSTLLGGFLADRYLGQKWATFWGGALIAAGMFVMSVPTISFLYIAMGLIILGNGFFKPNVVAIVGQLYGKNDARRDGGFTIFYMSVNIGAFFGPLLVGHFAATGNYKAAFWVSGIGMLIGLAIFMLGYKKFLPGLGAAPAKKPVFYKDAALWVIALAIPVIVLYMKGMHALSYGCFAALAAGYYLYHKNTKRTETEKAAPLTKQEKQQIAVIGILAFFSIFFWAAFEQAGAALNLFAYEYTDRVIHFFGHSWEIPANWFQSLNPLYVVIFAPLFSKLWIELAKKSKEPSTPAKFVISLWLLSLGFAVMLLGAFALVGNAKISLFYLALTYLFHTFAELCISPVGKSMVTKLAPARFVSLLIGVWYLSNAAANKLAGVYSGYFQKISNEQFFLWLVIVPLLVSGILMFFLKGIKKWMHGVH